MEGTVVTYAADGEEYEARPSAAMTAQVIYLKTFVAWYPVGFATERARDLWETYVVSGPAGAPDYRALGLFEGLTAAMASVHSARMQDAR